MTWAPGKNAQQAPMRTDRTPGSRRPGRPLLVNICLTCVSYVCRPTRTGHAAIPGAFVGHDDSAALCARTEVDPVLDILFNLSASHLPPGVLGRRRITTGGLMREHSDAPDEPTSAF